MALLGDVPKQPPLFAKLYDFIVSEGGFEHFSRLYCLIKIFLKCSINPMYTFRSVFIHF